jgi:hypothetical protein
VRIGRHFFKTSSKANHPLVHFGESVAHLYTSAPFIGKVTNKALALVLAQNIVGICADTRWDDNLGLFGGKDSRALALLPTFCMIDPVIDDLGYVMSMVPNRVRADACWF